MWQKTSRKNLNTTTRPNTWRKLAAATLPNLQLQCSNHLHGSDVVCVDGGDNGFGLPAQLFAFDANANGLEIFLRARGQVSCAPKLCVQLRAMYQLGDGPLFAGAVVAEDLAAHSAKCKIFVVCGLMRAVCGFRTCSGACE
jgi:hypothetical protein